MTAQTRSPGCHQHDRDCAEGVHGQGGRAGGVGPLGPAQEDASLLSRKEKGTLHGIVPVEDRRGASQS